MIICFRIINGNSDLLQRGGGYTGRPVRADAGEAGLFGVGGNRTSAVTTVVDTSIGDTANGRLVAARLVPIAGGWG